ncbi:MAG: ABC transporter ATP-binding protein [Firmicutes bacterium]|nr:ABC transporter ATP-binding protein [Bacillota bacterium]
MATLLALDHITKSYPMAGQEVPVLKGISFSVQEGEFVTIMGPSGSGKTTLMHILGCLDVPTQGEYHFRNMELAHLSEMQLTRVRREQIGFVFQNFNLLTTLNAVENVALPLIYQRISRQEQYRRAREALARVGLEHRLTYRPNQMSGGQQQRVAIARALVTRPPLILADEPTGNLDSQTGLEVLQLFKELSQEGHTIIMITHDHDVAKWGQRILEIKDGRIVADREVTA